MLYNNGNFGKLIKVLTNSIFNQQYTEHMPHPEGDHYLLDDNTSDEIYLLDDSEDYLLTD